MPRYFISTANHFRAGDEDGTEVPDISALRRLLRLTLAELLHSEGDEGDRNEFWADALDAAGRRVMTAKLSLIVVEP